MLIPLTICTGIGLALTVAGLITYGVKQTRTHTAMRDTTERRER